MNRRTLLVAAVLTALAAGAASTDPAARRDPAMTRTASGAFDVTIQPVAQEEFPGGTSLGRYSLEKRYHGDLEAAAQGEMLTAGTAVEGSAGYVAIERVEGTLHGRSGSFVLQHLGRMGHGAQHLTITVLPDSGTGELAGLEGELEIAITDGKHLYELRYTLSETP